MRIALLPLFFILSAGILPAQDASTVADPEIALTELGLRVRPLTQAELQVDSALLGLADREMHHCLNKGNGE